jgi:uncharacterized protein with HEPN domain
MREKKYLSDIQYYTNEIYIHLKNIETFDEYQKNITVKRAVERCLEVIGEAMNHLLSVNSLIEITGKRQIIALRNRIIHGYDKVSDTAIWAIIHDNLPVLKNEVEKLLEGYK